MQLKEITNITSEGINYVDEEDNQQFIDFETCYQNNLVDLEKRMGSQIFEKRKELYYEMKYVGVRYTE